MKHGFQWPRCLGLRNALETPNRSATGQTLGFSYSLEGNAVEEFVRQGHIPSIDEGNQPAFDKEGLAEHSAELYATPLPHRCYSGNDVLDDQSPKRVVCSGSLEAQRG